MYNNTTYFLRSYGMDIHADIIEYFDNAESPIVMVHGVNCFDLWRSGIAKQLDNKYDINVRDGDVIEKFMGGTFKTPRRYFEYGDSKLLGTIMPLYIVPNKVLVNAYTQLNPSSPDVRAISYDAVDDCFKLLQENVDMFTDDKHNVQIVYPRIGAGVANGHWETVQEIINFRLDGFNHSVVIRD